MAESARGQSLGGHQRRPRICAGPDSAEETGADCQHGFQAGHHHAPGNTAYNVSKAGVKATTEALAHALRNEPGCQVTAYLMIPGFVFTGMTARGRTEKPADAWTPEQTVDFMLESIGRGDFYILCPDGAVTRDMDERRMEWAANDIIRNRPALSRWHPDYKDAFEAHMKAPKK